MAPIGPAAAASGVAGDPSEGDGPFFSNYWGWQMVCGSSSGCNQNAGIALNSVLLTAAEGQGPNLSATGANNLVSQTSRYVWNAVGQPYPIPVVDVRSLRGVPDPGDRQRDGDPGAHRVP